MSPRAVFVGPMAAGKTKVGKRVARHLGTGFLDTDQGAQTAAQIEALREGDRISERDQA